MLHAYRLVYPISQHAPPQLWEYEQPYINNLILNARTFNRFVAQWYFKSWEALDLTFRTLFCPSKAICEEPPVEGGAGATYRLFHAL
jgi:hypothetical protein